MSAETPEQMADRMNAAMTKLARQHVDLLCDTFGLDLDKECRREIVGLGIEAGYLATMQMLVEEKLLPPPGEKT